jgi:hypothetical protein
MALGKRATLKDGIFDEDEHVELLEGWSSR